ncbi:uncharacterized protein [Elaeis guineensis]|uniref:Uncharacterized protein LOC105039075 isoform X2 n=1 Tax=Elaeis guineensis var. tenera TaxID=51953 RepID=A0A6J0PFC7_ELAGV|nr:uncharacterized protein LOC105039075 isoform X2 [Elaeis guineensis]
MDDAWHVKCGSAWPPPPAAALTPSLPLPPPPMAPQPPQLPAMGSASQVAMNLRQHIHPSIAQESFQQDQVIVQESLVFNSLNLDSCKSGKTELGNSFLALLSGEFSQLPNSRPSLTKLHDNNGGIDVSGASSAAPVASITTMPENHGNDVMGNGNELSSFVASRSFLSTCMKPPVLHNNLQVTASPCCGMESAKQTTHQAFQGKNLGVAAPSMGYAWPTIGSPSNASQCHTLNVQTLHKMSFETKPSVSCHASSFLRGRPRVFCMNTVGELFASDIGLFGVVCFCHSLPMSVAKFCEHSGSPSANPGEAVHLENGMTLAQWRKLCLGIMAPDDGSGWDWSDSSLVKGALLGSKASKVTTLFKNPEATNTAGAFGGLWKPGEPWNKFLYNGHPYTAVGGYGTLGKSLNKEAENADPRYYLNGHNLFSKNLSSSSESVMPPVAKHQTVQAVKQSHACVGRKETQSSIHKGEQNVGHHFDAYNIDISGKCGNPSMSSPYAGTKKSFSHDYSISSGYFSSESSMVNRDGASSTIELRLGQPSQHNHTFPGSVPAAVLQFGALCNSKRPQFSQPLTCRNDYPRETKTPRLNLQHTPSEVSSSHRHHPQHAVETTNAINRSESKDLMGDATKNSMISLFLSHLEGNNTSQCVDNIANNSEHFLSRLLDGDSVSVKCNLSDSLTDIADGIRKGSDAYQSDLFKNVDKELEVVDNCMVKSSYLVQNKPMADTRFPALAGSGHHPYSSSREDDRQSSLYLSQLPAKMQPAPDARNSNQCAKVSSFASRDHCDHAFHRSTNPVPYAAKEPGSLNSDVQVNLSSTNSLRASEPSSSFSNKNNVDTSQPLMDENLKVLALRHMVEFSKQEKSTASLETGPQHRRLCCLSSKQLQRNVCQDDLIAPEELRQEPFVNIHQDISKIAARSIHSCPNCHITGVQVFTGKPGFTGPNRCCNCIAATRRDSVCSKGHGIQFSSCCICGVDEQPCLRLGRLSNSTADCAKFEVCKQKEQSPYSSGKCCSSLCSNCVTGHILESGSPYDALGEQNVCGKAKLVHIMPPCDKDDLLRDSKRSRLSQCECFKNNTAMKNDSQTALSRDVPSKVIAHSDGIIGKPAQVLEVTTIVDDQVAENIVKEIDGINQDSESMKAEQMSNISSGSSAAAVTEVSVEANNVDSCSRYVSHAKTLHDFVVDEGSGIEKCGSSDEALGGRECIESLTFKGNMDPARSGLLSLPNHSSHEAHFENSCKRKRVRNQIIEGCKAHEKINQKWHSERMLEADNGKEPMELNRLDVSIPVTGFSVVHSESSDCIGHSKVHLSLTQGVEAPSLPDDMMQKTCISSCRSSSIKRKRSALSSPRPHSIKRFDDHYKLWEPHKMQSVSDDHSFRTFKVLAEKKEKQDLAAGSKQENRVIAGKAPKFVLLSCIGSPPNHGKGIMDKKVRPVVCGNLGVISSGGTSGPQKPAKIVPLSLILKKARCSTTEFVKNAGLPISSKTKKARLSAKLSSWKLRLDENSKVVEKNGADSGIPLMSQKDKGFSSKNDECLDDSSMTAKETDAGNNKTIKPSLCHKRFLSQSKPKYKDIHECTLLAGKDENAINPTCLPTSGKNEGSDSVEAENQLATSSSTGIADNLVGMEDHGKKICSRKALKCVSSRNIRSLNNSKNNQDHAGKLCQVSTRRCSKENKCPSFLLDSEVFCCVCGGSNQEDVNHLLECNRCMIRVHQACYGVSKLPKGHWYCRPCKSNSKNIVCVLCGYEGGAMTRALKSRNIVKSLLRAWKVGLQPNSMKSVPSSDILKNELLGPGSVGEASGYQSSGSAYTAGEIDSNSLHTAVLKMDVQNLNKSIQQRDVRTKNFQACNSVIAGVLDPSITQWVHMVCGLWTPGTRCPNVGTMSAFDVSGASLSRKNAACSMCKRPGGSCIECRVPNCSVLFHPWCAHQKGLLQSEVEGDDNDKVGFYGRCLDHATFNSFNLDGHPVDPEEEIPRNRDWTCARTEGFKGRKREEGLDPTLQKPYKDGGGCIVSQEQINAWLHINGQKSCARGVVKPPCSDVEYDFREYICYKQTKGWKHLVVYKSGIHALGLYTSKFIARGAMVVEYVGEIVGLRVADKREIEYESGRRLQYKSACYFFRIDKEHIIDATRKGGIARFVNHSCLPNCVAKVISVRNEKKVVFFAERDINPGEEITYDYHFNHEDEGKKIPCFCNSKNCRRYLN